MELGDKETIAICIQASVTCYLHVIHSYTRMVIPYAYGIKYAYGTEHVHDCSEIRKLRNSIYREYTLHRALKINC